MDKEFLGHTLLAGAAVMFFGAFGFGWIWAHLARAKTLLKKWSDSQDLQILEFKRPFFAGPFNPTNSGQVTFFVRVRDRNGHERSGWVRFGGFWGVLVSDNVKVIWKT